MDFPAEITKTLAAALPLLRRSDYAELRNLGFKEKFEWAYTAMDQAPSNMDTAWTLIRHRVACFLFELLNYDGELKAAGRTVLELSDQARALLERPSRAEEGETIPLPTRKQLVWTLIHRATFELKDGSSDIASRFLDFAEQATTAWPATGGVEDSTSLGIKSRLYFVRGQISLQKSRFPEARANFTKAIEALQQRLHAKRMQSPAIPEGELLEEQKAATNLAGKYLAMGLSQVSLRSGQLSRARASLATARIMLAASPGDYQNTAYLEILYCQSLRKSGGSLEDRLRDWEEAARLLERLDQLPSRPPKMRARICYEAAMVYLQWSRFVPRQLDVVGKWIDTLRIVAKEQGRRDWVLASHTLRSYFVYELAKLQNQDKKVETLKRASKLARRVAQLSGESRPTQKAEALLAKGRADLALHYILGNVDLESVVKEIQGAIQLIEQNHVLKAVGELILCQLFIALREGAAAAAAFQRASRALDSSFEHGFVKDLMQETREDLERMHTTFVLSANQWPLDYNAIQERLRRWLLSRAEEYRKANPDAGEPHKLLGVSRATVFNWKRRVQEQPLLGVEPKPLEGEESDFD